MISVGINLVAHENYFVLGLFQNNEFKLFEKNLKVKLDFHIEDKYVAKVIVLKWYKILNPSNEVNPLPMVGECNMHTTN
jgi:hypothetical protein